MAAPITIVQANKQSDEETCLLVEAPPPAVIHELKDSPLEWSLQYKWIVVVLLESMTCLEYVSRAKYLWMQPLDFLNIS